MEILLPFTIIFIIAHFFEKSDYARMKEVEIITKEENK